MPASSPGRSSGMCCCLPQPGILLCRVLERRTGTSKNFHWCSGGEGCDVLIQPSSSCTRVRDGVPPGDCDPATECGPQRLLDGILRSLD
eukprot:s9745_g2.t1